MPGDTDTVMRKAFWILLLLVAGCSATPRAAGSLPLPVAVHDRAAALVFVRIDCPISNGYAPELNRIFRDYANQGIDFYLIYIDENISIEQARQHAAEFGYHCPVLLDEKHRLVAELKITVTPEVAIISRAGGLLYRGRIDDTYAAFGQKRFAPTTHDLRDALDAIAHDRAVAVSSTVAVGCSIQ